MNALPLWRFSEEPRIERLHAGDPEWPSRLDDLHDPPLSLHVNGNVSLLALRSVAIVGARAASPSGCELSWLLAHDLAREGVSIVSGLARGIDSAAHEGALAAGGATVAVLGCGIDVCYPAGSRALYDQVARSGLLVSEFPKGAPPLRMHFPKRNRLIAALAEVVVVVEGAARSGSRITVDLALDLGREVMAVPRDPLGEGAETPNRLLREGAPAATCADDVREALGLPRLVRPRRSGKRLAPPAQHRWLWNRLDGNPRSAETLRVRCDRPFAEIVQGLAELEVTGYIERIGVGLYRRKTER
jgi:DNA processing protein